LEGLSFQIIWGVNVSIWLAPTDPPGAPALPRIRNCIVLLATYEQQISTDALCVVFDRVQDRPVNQIVTLETAQALGFVLAE
jgi:hypothetical protein